MFYKIHTLNEQLLDIYILYLRCDFLICRDKNFPSSVTNNMWVSEETFYWFFQGQYDEIHKYKTITMMHILMQIIWTLPYHYQYQVSHWAWWMRAVWSARIERTLMANPCYTRHLIHQTAALWYIWQLPLWYTRQLLSDTPDSCSLIHQADDLWYTRADSCSMIHRTAALWYTRQLSLVHQTAALFYTRQLISDTPDS